MINQRITKLRQLMKERGIDLYIIPTSDFHQSEYVGSYFEARHYMSGFSGSAGTLIVRQDEAYLWTDGRYFIQAEKELAGSCIQLMKMRTPGVPTIKEYIEKYPEATIGFDGRVMPYNQCLFTNTIQANEDLVDLIWQERPELSHEEVYLYDTKYCGVSRKEKLEIIREEMKDAKYHLVTTLDDIAWIFNIRGNDVLCNPVALAYALIEKEKANLYLRKEAVSQELIDELLKDQIEVKDYFDIYEDIKNINGKVLLDTKSVNYTLVNSINIDDVIDQTNPSQLLKSIKNETEIKATKDAHLHDGIAVTKFMYWLKTNIGKMEMDELSISNKLLEYRKQQPNFKDISFTTICAYRENAALMHYHPTEKQYSKVNASHLLLIDSGGQYLTGTTDITRTIVVGPLTEEEKDEVRSQIGEFRKYAPLIQNGRYYRLTDPFKSEVCAWEIVGNSQEEVLLNVVMEEIHGNMTVNYVQLRGLDESALYKEQTTGRIYSGAALMHGGMPLPAEFGEYRAYQYHFVRE